MGDCHTLKGLGFVWHLILFEDYYAALQIYRSDIIVPFGFLSMSIQAVLCAWLYGKAFAAQSGGWLARGLRYALTGGSFVADENAGKRTPDWMAGLRYKSEAPLTTVTYWDYLNRRTARQTPSAVTSGPTPLPSLVLTLPATAVPAFLTHVSSTPEVSLGITIFEVSPKIAARFSQPLYKVPAAPLIFELRMQRRASTENAPDHKQMLRANQALLERLFSVGGKVYPPFAPVLSHEQWRLQYGAETWPRFAAAKQRFDPASVLTPGAGMF